MPTGLKRYQESGQFHFVTFSCYRRKPLLASPEAKHTVEHILEQTRAQQHLTLFAYVLMPEHVHLLIDEPARDTLATFLQTFKQRSSAALMHEGHKQFWQRRYYDRNVRTEAETAQKIRYIHENPVKRGLVNSAELYRWSSAACYLTDLPPRLQVQRYGA